MKLSDRIYHCDCGYVEDRDFNAALNLKDALTYEVDVYKRQVDESDVVKTDGKYIYMVEDGQISITDISNGKPGEETLFLSLIHI